MNLLRLELGYSFVWTLQSYLSSQSLHLMFTCNNLLKSSSILFTNKMSFFPCSETIRQHEYEGKRPILSNLDFHHTKTYCSVVRTEKPFREFDLPLYSRQMNRPGNRTRFFSSWCLETVGNTKTHLRHLLNRSVIAGNSGVTLLFPKYLGSSICNFNSDKNEDMMMSFKIFC